MTLTPVLTANISVDVAALELHHHDLPSGQVVSGRPHVGAAELGWLGEYAIGVWEISPGVSTDVEADEIFVVLSGLATVEFADGSPSLCLKAGSLVRLAAGSATTWTVTETLRKVYVL